MTAVITFDKHIKKPTRATRLSVGLDFYAPETVKILPRNCIKIDLKFQIKPPANHFTLLKERSSLSVKNITCGGGSLTQTTWAMFILCFIIYRGKHTLFRRVKKLVK